MAASAETERREDDRGVYVYGVTLDIASFPAGVSGVADEAVFAIHDDRVAAIVGRVSLDEFGEEPLRRNLNDLEWLERVARTHEAVVERAMELQTVLPARLATVYRGERDVVQMLEREQERLVAALERVRGAREWGVKAFADPTQLAESVRRSRGEAAELRAVAEAKSGGTAYFAWKAHDEFVREAAAETKARCASSTHNRLRELAADARLHPLERSALSREEGELILNGAYLVRLEQEDAFRMGVRGLESELAPVGVRLYLTGPWPPYNFADQAAVIE
jgi:gas vesicle protein GvpL/GvpF